MRIVRLILVTGAFLGVWAAGASAHYLDSSGNFLFGGVTFSDSNGTSNRTLPMNVMFVPFAYSTDAAETHMDRLKRHMDWHLPSNRHYSDDRGLDPLCHSSPRFLDIPANRTPLKASNDNMVIWRSQPGTKDRCHNRYHARVFFDDSHPGGGHSEEANRWIVAQFHHELYQTGPAGLTHYFDMPWETVEYRIARFFRRVNTPHNDPQGNGFDFGHCTNRNWKKLIGSHGWFGGKRRSVGEPKGKDGYYSNGSITRVSLLHCAARP